MQCITFTKINVRANLDVSINEAIDECIELAKQLDTNITLTFLNVDLEIYKHSRFDILYNEYNNIRKEKGKLYATG